MKFQQQLAVGLALVRDTFLLTSVFLVFVGKWSNIITDNWGS